jgi:hypothetical protein
MLRLDRPADKPEDYLKVTGFCSYWGLRYHYTALIKMQNELNKLNIKEEK